MGVLVTVQSAALTRFPRVAVVVGIASMLQTVPSLAFSWMIPLWNRESSDHRRTIYLFTSPILRNTYIGMNDVMDDQTVRGMGMTTMQSIVQVELPMAMQVIMAGIRLSAVYVIAWATLASYIGAGGLGDFIFNGLNLYQPDLIIGGTIPVTILALVVDYLLGRLEYHLTPVSQR